MNIKEAEEFFKKYHGHGYHMWHDDSVKNREFDSMKISPELKEQWRQDLIQDFFEHMLDDPDIVPDFLISWKNSILWIKNRKF